MNQEFKTNDFDLLRIFTATEVLLAHSSNDLKIPFPLRLKLLSHFPGVTIFFVISGFLTSASWERNSKHKNYFRNIFLRIHPAFWFCVILCVFAIYFVSKIDFYDWRVLEWFIRQCLGILYTPGSLNDFGLGSYNGSLWTIFIELQFYILLPVFFYIISHFITSEFQKIIWLVACLVFCYFSPNCYLCTIIGQIFWISIISMAYTFSIIANKNLKGNDVSYRVYIYHGLILGVLVQLKFTGSYYSIVTVVVAAYVIALLLWRPIEKPAIQKKEQALKEACLIAKGCISNLILQN